MPTRRRRWADLLACLAHAAFAVECTPFKTGPSPGPGESAGAPVDAGAGPQAVSAVSASAPPPSSAPCTHHGPPKRPSVQNAGGTYDLLFAANTVRFGTKSWDDAGRPEFEDIGFDLDMRCTSAGESPACIEPPWATAVQTDGFDGIDNANGQAWWMQLEDSHMVTADMGPVGLLRIASYSGDPDDDQVDVSFYLGLFSPRGDGGSDEAGSEPVWDGQDRWNILSETLLGSIDGGPPSVDRPRYHDPEAYVSNGVVVAHFDELLWPSGLAGAPNLLLTVHQVVTAGSLTRTAGGWKLDPLVTGMRMGINDALLNAALLPAASPDVVICQVRSLYTGTKQKTCSYVDVRSAGDDPSMPCDAMSIGVLFQAQQVGFGDVLAPLPPFVLPCASGIDPRTDTCP